MTYNCAIIYLPFPFPSSFPFLPLSPLIFAYLPFSSLSFPFLSFLYYIYIHVYLYVHKLLTESVTLYHHTHWYRWMLYPQRIN